MKLFSMQCQKCTVKLCVPPYTQGVESVFVRFQSSQLGLVRHNFMSKGHGYSIDRNKGNWSCVPRPQESNRPIAH